MEMPDEELLSVLETNEAMLQGILVMEGIETMSHAEIDEVPLDTLFAWVAFSQERERLRWDASGIKAPVGMGRM